MAIGHAYILINAAMAGYLKIGSTTRTPEERASELSATTGVPVPFSVAYPAEVADCLAAEKVIHERLPEHRVNKELESRLRRESSHRRISYFPSVLP